MRLWMLLTAAALLLAACEGNTVKTVKDNDTAGDDTTVVGDDDTAGSDFAPVDADFAESCGDGAINNGEPCDGNMVNCTAIDPVKYTGGKAKCNETCTGYDTITCDENPSVCGNGIVESPELCDGTIDNCVDIDPFIFAAGKARCKEDCSGWDTETCESTGDYCGDGMKSETEFCDGDAKACTDINPGLYESGNAPCNQWCSGYDTTSCVVIQSVCGDGTVEGTEVCEEGTLEDCVDIDPFSYSGGKAYCLDDCSGYDIVTCEENSSGTLFYDSFENGESKWLLEKDWQIGSPNYTVSVTESITGAYSGANVLATNLTGPYTLAGAQGSGYTEAAIIANSITIPTGKTTTLMFRAYVYTEYYTSTSDPTQNAWYDGMIVELYEDGTKLDDPMLESNVASLVDVFKVPSAGGYVSKTGIRGHSAADTYALFSADLSAYAGKTVSISFLFISDYMGNNFGIAMDDVTITAE